MENEFGNVLKSLRWDATHGDSSEQCTRLPIVTSQLKRKEAEAGDAHGRQVRTATGTIRER